MIQSREFDKVYIGSTTMSLVQRFSYHKSNYERFIHGNSQKYYSSYEILKYQDVMIKLVEKFPCKSKAELNKREAEIIEMCKNAQDPFNDFSGCVNQVTPYRYNRKDKGELTPKQKSNEKYYLTHKEKCSSSNKRVICEICNIDVQKSYFIRHCKTANYLRNEKLKQLTTALNAINNKPKESDGAPSSTRGSESESENEK